MKIINRLLTLISCVFLSLSCFVIIGRGDFITEGESSDISRIEIETTNDIPVCYNDATKTKFTTIEKALEVAKANQNADTIYVLPGTNPIITRNCEIASGDTLCFPFADDAVSIHDYGEFRENDLGTTFADSNESNVSKYRKNYVKLNDGVNLLNNGTLIIGGKLGIGEGGQKPVSHTGADYVELNLGINSSIFNKGTLKLYGYIKESRPNNGSKVLNYENSFMYMPFVIYDFLGGSYTLYAYRQKVLPFNIFDFPNCHSNLIVNSGAKLFGMVTIYAQKWAVTDVVIIGGTNDSALFKLSNGSIRLKYNASNPGFTVNDALSNNVEEKLNKTDVIINGDSSFSSIQLSLGDFPLIGEITVDTANYFCSVSYKFNIVIESGIFTIQNKAKFLCGSNITILENATAYFNAPVIFYQNYVPLIMAPIDRYPRILANGNGKLRAYGKLVSNSAFGGLVETNDKNKAIFSAIGFNFNNSVTTTEATKGETGGMTGTKENHSESAKALISTDGTTPSATSLIERNQVLIGKNNYWITDNKTFSIYPNSGESNKKAEKTYEIKLNLDPSIDESRIVEIKWSNPQNCTLKEYSDDPKRVTFTTPANTSIFNDRKLIYRVYCNVKYKTDSGLIGEIEVFGEYVAVRR